MKKCFKCEQEKSLSQFYKHAQMKDGHLNKCIECTKKDATKFRNNNIEKVRDYDRVRARLPHRTMLNTETTRRMRNKFPHIYKAHTALNNAVRDGKIIKPDRCSNCNEEGKLHAHHNDYSRPLEVEWLCVVCHRQFHKDLNSDERIN